MKKMMLAAAMAVVTVAPLAAVTVGPDWCVAYPQEGSKEVNSALRFAAEEVAGLFIHEKERNYRQWTESCQQAAGRRLESERKGKRKRESPP